MYKFIEVQKRVKNSGTMASHEVEDVIMDVIEQFYEAGFDEEDIKDGIEFALKFGF